MPDDQVVGATKHLNKKALCSNSEPFFPDELYVEILGWLSVADLLRCKCVCKKWFEIVQDRKFIELHKERAELKYLHRSEDGMSGSDEIDLEFQIACSLDGLLLETSTSSQKLRIRNPATRRVLDLPYPNHKVYDIFMSYIPNTGSYKVVSLYVEGEREKACLEGLDIDRGDFLWKKFEILNDHEQDGGVKGKTKVGLHNPVFSLRSFVGDELGETEIIVVDISEEIFTSCEVPKRLFLSNHQQVMLWNDKLSVTSIMDEELHVWVMEDHMKQKWADSKIIIPLTEFLKLYPLMKECIPPVLAEGERIWFDLGKGELCVYNFKSKRSECIVSAPERTELGCIYRPSLITLKGMQPWEKHPVNEVEQSSS